MMTHHELVQAMLDDLSKTATIGFSGHFTLTLYQADEKGEPILATGRVVADFDNLITDTGLDMIGTGTDYSVCAVGTGSTAPANTDTTLVAQLTQASSRFSSVSSYNLSPEYGQRIDVFRFAVGVAAGNLAEVGMKSGSSLFSRALILDGLGAPTTITVLSSEVLDVTYVLRIQPPAGDFSDTVVINGVTYNYIARPMNVGSWQNCIGGVYVYSGPSMNSYTGAIGARASSPGGGGSGSTMALAAYSPGSKTRQYTGNFGLTQANGNNTAFSVNGQAFFQFGIVASSVPKTSAQVMSITLALSWDRV